MAGGMDTKFSFLNSQVGACARKGHHMDWSWPQKEQAPGPARSKSLAALSIPAGYSNILGNKLGLSNYQNLNGKYHARFDVKPPCKAPRQMEPDRKRRTELTWQAPERMKPETLGPAGGTFKHPKGKRMIDSNTNYLSNVDTLIFGRDVDGSMGCRSQADAPIYKGSAGLNAKWERTPAWGELPPVCLRTFGDGEAENTWEAVHYDRLDPRKDYAEDMNL